MLRNTLVSTKCCQTVALYCVSEFYQTAILRDLQLITLQNPHTFFPSDMYKQI